MSRAPIVHFVMFVVDVLRPEPIEIFVGDKVSWGI